MSKAEPFTTSDVIAEYAEVRHHAIQQIIAKHETDLQEFGVLAFKMRKPTSTKGGAPEKIYCLNEQQATLVITYLKNTAPVRAFKKELVRQFYEMRSELMQRRAARAELKPIRRELTDIIRDSPDIGRWAYKHFTDLAYKHALGKTAAQIRKERNADVNAPAVAYMTAEELEKVAKASQRIVVLIDLGMSYKEIDEKLKNRERAAGTAQLTV